MRPAGRVFVYIDVEKKQYSRYSGKTRTHVFEGDEIVAPYWIEMLRTAPETWEVSNDKETA